MRRQIAVLVTVLLAVAGVSVIEMTVMAGPAHAKDANCSDFSTQAAAQQYFINHGGPNSDPDGLDSDGDGIACESNNCPCSTSQGGGGGGHPAPHKKKHSLVAKVKRTGPMKKLMLVGKVTTFKGGQVQVLRKPAGRGFKFYKRAKASPKTGAFGRPLAYVGNDKTCFQVVVPETKKYLKTSKFLGCFVKP